MNALDLVVMAVLFFHAIKGLTRGLILILFDLLALLGGVWMAWTYYQDGALYLYAELGMPEPYTSFISFALQAVAYMGCSFLGNVLHHAVRPSVIGPVNLLGGVFFGAIKGFLFVLPVLIPLSHADYSLYRDSQIAKPVSELFSKRLVGVNAERYIKADPVIDTLQNALESGNTEAVDQLLEGWNTR